MRATKLRYLKSIARYAGFGTLEKTCENTKINEPNETNQ